MTLDFKILKIIRSVNYFDHFDDGLFFLKFKCAESNFIINSKVLV